MLQEYVLNCLYNYEKPKSVTSPGLFQNRKVFYFMGNLSNAREVWRFRQFKLI